MTTEDSIFSILHISDFHFSEKKYREQKIIVEALERDVRKLCVGHRQPAFVVFTGDLVNAGGVDSHLSAYDNFISIIANAANCSDERTILVPGNHDLDRGIVEKNAQELKDWRQKSVDRDSLNRLYSDGLITNSVQDKFAHFYELRGLISTADLVFENAFATLYRIDAKSIEILVLNTAVLSGAGSKLLDVDRANLAISEYALLEVEQHFRANCFRVVGSHHPLSWLNETSCKIVARYIQKHADIHLYGHMHEPLTSSMVGFDGKLFTNQAGAIFAGRDRYIGYSLITFDRSSGFYETQLRSYYDERSAFDAAIDVIANGVFYPSSEASQFWRKIASPIDDGEFRRHLSSECTFVLDQEMENIGFGDRKLKDLFVASRMKRTSVKSSGKEQSDITVEEVVEFTDVLQDHGNIILHSPPEYGKTSVLRQIEHRLCAEAENLDFARIPIFIEFEEIKHNITRLTSLLRGRLSSVTQRYDFEALIRLGRICIIVDDVDFALERTMGILRKFVIEFPKARYIFSAQKTSVTPYGTSIDPEMPVPFDIVELCALRRSDMRSLVEKWDVKADVDGILDRIQEEIGGINLPFTAANGSILMVIFEEQSNFRPINRSVLIEQFVDIILKKGSEEQSQRETFDFHNKTALLAHIAAWMSKKDVYVVEAEELREEMKSYIDHIEVNVDLDKQLAEFFGCRIFVKKNDGRVSFGYRAVLEYFIALQMRRSSEFKEWVLGGDRYLTFLNEIQYYAGAVRDDQSLIELVFGRHLLIVEKLSSVMEGIDLTKIVELDVRPRKEESDSLGHLERQLYSAPLTAEERDSELEAELPKDSELRQEVFRPKIQHEGHEFFLSLTLFSGLLKNLEEIPGAMKRKYLDHVLRSWGVFLYISLLIVPELAQKRKVRINGVLYELAASRGFSDTELARLISLGLPVSMTKLISASLGTEKLEQQLMRPEFADSEAPLTNEFFRSALIADLKLSKTGDASVAALKALESSPFLLEAFAYKIRDLRRLHRISDAQFEVMRAQLAESIASLRGFKGSALAEAKRKELSRMKKSEITLKITQKER